MQQRLVLASAIAVVVAAAFLVGSGRGSSAAVVRDAQGVPAGLADAIHSRLGAGAIGSSRATCASCGPHFGYSVALSADGTTALVGADGVGQEKGAAYIFHVSGAGSWSSSQTPTAALRNKNGRKGDYFGWDTALSADGSTAFVSAPFADASGPDGVIYVFHVSDEDAWASSSTPTATLTAKNGDLEGQSIGVSADGTTLVIGDPLYDFTGGAYIFHVSSEDAWVSSSTPTATLSNEGADDFAGFFVAISGDGTTVLVSDDQNSIGASANVYHVASESSWTTSSTPTAILSDATIPPSNSLDDEVALSGDGTVAFLAAPEANSGTGAVDVFHASAADAWASTSTPTATLTTAGGSDKDYFASSVAVSADGTTALVAAPGVHKRRGAAFIFHVSGEGAWASTAAPTATLTDSGGQAGDLLGWGALSADGATALGGAIGVQFWTGAADVFHVSDASSWASTSTPTAILSNAALEACVVPALRRLTLPVAKARLRARSCRLGRVGRVQSKARTGHVVSQSRMPYARLPVGTKVAVKVAK